MALPWTFMARKLPRISMSRHGIAMNLDTGCHSNTIGHHGIAMVSWKFHNNPLDISMDYGGNRHEIIIVLPWVAVALPWTVMARPRL